MVKAYEDKNFIILSSSNKKDTAFILFNKHKEFENGHTHLNNYKTALWIMNLYVHRKLPLDLKSPYLLQSLIRISNDEVYTQKVTELMETRLRKSKGYYINVQKGIKKKSKRR